MRLIFAGSPDFAATALSALLDAGHDIPLVLTQPDRPAGRGMRLMPSPVKALATSRRLKLFQPVTLRNNSDAISVLAETEADAMIVAAYGLILPQTVLDLPPLGCINIHASLLPRWRGAAPIQRAILAGDACTGISIMQMDHGLDTGPVLAHAEIPIHADDTAATLHDRLAALGANLLVATLSRLPLPAAPQPEDGATYAAKLEKTEADLDWTQSADELDRRIRAFHPFPVARTLWQGTPLRIWRVRTLSETTAGVPPGTLLDATPQGVTVACGKGTLLLTELQKAGGKRLSAAQFIAGHPFITGKTRLGS